LRFPLRSNAGKEVIHKHSEGGYAFFNLRARCKRAVANLGFQNDYPLGVAGWMLELYHD